MAANWLDLVDPTREELLYALPAYVDPEVVEALASPATRLREPRPLLESHGSYVFGVLLAMRPLPDEDRVDHQLEDRIDELLPATVRRRITELRHELNRRRGNATATRAAVRRVLDGRVDVGDRALFPPDVERLFGDTYDTLVRATEELDLARDLLASARDHLQARIAESQSDVAKKLTVIASLVLVPSLIVGFYGQNFESVFDDAYWSVGVSGGLIVASTIVQLALFRWRRWI